MENNKLTYQELEKKAEILQTFANNSYDWEMIVNLSGEIKYISPSCELISGYSIKEFIENPQLLTEIIHPSDKEIVCNHFDKKTQHIAKTISLSYRIITKNGNTKWIEHNCKKAFDKSNNFIGYSSSNRDVTIRKDAENQLLNIKEELSKSEKLFRSIFDNSAVGISLTQIEGTLKINKKFSDILGYSHKEFQQKNWKDITHKDDINISNQIVDKILSGEASTLKFEKRYIHKNGSIVYTEVRTTLQKDAEGKALFFISTIIDISERKKAEQKTIIAKKKAKESEVKFNKLSNLTFEGIIIHQNGIAIDINLSFAQIFDYTREEIIGENVIKLIIKEEYHSIISQNMLKKYALPYEVVGIRKDGMELPLELESRNFESDNKTIRVAAVRVISERKKFEQKLLKKNKELIIAKGKAEESEIRFKALHNASFGGIAIHDKGIILDTNLGLSTLTGYTVDELIGMDGLLLIAEKYREKVMSNILSNFEKPYEVIGLRKNKEEYPVRLEARAIPHKGKKVRVVEFRDISERKKAEEKIIIAKGKAEESRKYFKALVGNGNDVVTVISKTGSVLYRSHSYEKVLGYKIDEITENLFDLIHPDDRERMILEFSKFIHKIGEIQKFHYRYFHKDKTWRDIEGTGKNMLNLPVINGIVLNFRDVTKRKKAEKRYLKMFENMKSGVAIYLPIENGNDFIFIDFNKAAEKITNASKNEIVGKSLLSTFPNMNKTPFFKALQTVYKTNKDLVLPAFYYKDKKREGWRENYIYKLSTGEIVAIFDDITDRKNNDIKLQNKNKELTEAKERAEESKARFDLAMRATKDGIYDWNLITNEIYYSPGWKNILGYKNNELPNDISVWKKLTDAKDVKKTLKMQQELINKQQNGFDIEFKMKHKDGHWVDILSRAEIFFDKKNKAIRMVGTHVDISERKLAEKELLIAKEKAEESDQLKTEFINNMSHEIRTPMNGILGFSNLLDNPNNSEEKRNHYVNIIQNSGNQLMRIIDDILEISKLGTKQVKAVEKEICLNDIFLELFSVFDIKAKENKTPLYLKKGLSDQESTILTDETKLNKILSNLLENALKFTNEGFIEFGYQQINHELEIYVKDTGIGINLDKQEIIFERFSQEEKELSKNVGGLGLGLSIAKENTELLGGRVALKSEKKKGSTFFVTIPYKPVNSKIDNNNLANNKNEIVEKKVEYSVLIVEDEEVNYLYLEILLEDQTELNYKTIHAKHGKEAIEICKSNSEIDFILMDLKMPIMNGFEATKQIKKFRPDLPIIAQTAYTTNQDKEKAFSAGCDDFISKPISKETFNEIMKKYLKIK